MLEVIFQDGCCLSLLFSSYFLLAIKSIEMNLIAIETTPLQSPLSLSLSNLAALCRFTDFIESVVTLLVRV